MNFGSSVAKAFDFLDVSVGNSCCFSPPLPRIFLRAFPTGLHYNTLVFVAGFTVDIIVVVSSVVVAAFGRLLPWYLKHRGSSVIGLASSLTFMLFAAALEGNEISWHLTRFLSSSQDMCPGYSHTTSNSHGRLASLAYT